jgi:hypothetical protein
MANIPPFHSIMQRIYHDNSTCPDANTIQVHHKRQGTAGKKKCSFCQKLGTSANKEAGQSYISNNERADVLVISSNHYQYR